MVDLKLIEKAIRSIFVLEDNPTTKFYGNVGLDGGQDIPRLCIVALAHLHGIKEEEVCVFIDVIEETRIRMLNKFEEHQGKYRRHLTDGAEMSELNKRVMLKFSLCENYIKLHMPTQFISAIHYL